MNKGRQIEAITEADKESLINLGRELFSCPELGFKEVKSNEILTSFLFKNGIPCQSGLCLTGVKATIGGGSGYHIALVADLDALEARDGSHSFPFHSCGHSIQTAVMAYALKLLNDSGIVERFGGRVSFIATPAEEFIDFDYRESLVQEGKIAYYSGKQNMIAQGIFDDVDCVISMHVNGETDTLFDINSTLAGFMVKKAVFIGQASHSGAAPHLGKNALHGASLCMNAVAYMKDQFSKDAGIQIHPVLTSCQGSVNIIPEEAVLETYIRANTLEELLSAGEKYDLCVEHCAKALGLDYRIENRTGYMPLKQSGEINGVIKRQMLKLCREDQIVKDVISGASGDVGDLGYLLPTVQFGFSGIKGRIHSGSFEIADEGHVYIDTLQVVLGAVEELLAHKELQVKNADFKQRKSFYLKNWLEKKSGCGEEKG